MDGSRGYLSRKVSSPRTGGSRSRSAISEGRFVVLIGPDGVGKTAVARALVKQFPGKSRYFHFRPTWRHQTLPGADSGQRPEPGLKQGRLAGCARLTLNFFRFWFGYLVSVRPFRRSGGLVVGDRWAFGYLLDPASVRYGGPKWFASFVLQRLPRPDLVAALIAPPEVIHARKPELSLGEIDRQLKEMRSLPLPVVFIEATEEPGVVASRILAIDAEDRP